MINRLKIGLLPFYLKLYDDFVPSIKSRINAFHNTISTEFVNRGVVVVTVSPCRLESEFNEAVEMFENANVDCIVTLHLAYSPSLESYKSLTRTKLPIVILDTTETYDFIEIVSEDEISYNHGIHGVQDMCNILNRYNKNFYIEAGHWQRSDVINRVIKRVEGIRIAENMRTAKVGRIGDFFKGMGDFSISLSKMQTDIGIESVQFDFNRANDYFSKISDDEIQREISENLEIYAVDDLDPALHKMLAKNCLAVRKWCTEEELTALTINFLYITKEHGFDCMPFVECSKAMSRGVGYAGEGDILSAALVGALLSVFEETSFTEMFCPDWKNNLIFLSHMGEINTKVCAEKPRLLKKNFPYTNANDTAFTCGKFKPGSAVFVNLAPAPEGKFKLIVSTVTIIEITSTNYLNDNVSGWIAPKYGLSEFLEKYSIAGGTHHSAIVYGDVKKAVTTFGIEMGWDVIDLDLAVV
ncbi:MAG: hypothetical protein PHV38_00175 [Eubacteriales bacterium]|nr:hypothetical protein [Eubacteriales bacterium]